MPNDNHDKQKAYELDLINAYKSFNETPHGKLIMEDITNRFLWHDSRPHVAAGNALGVAFIDGQRMLVRYIHNRLNRTQDEQLAKYDVPTELNQGDPLDGFSGQSKGFI